MTGKTTMADIIGIQNIAKTGPLKAIAPWLDNDYFSLAVDATNSALSFAEDAMNWRTEATAASSLGKTGVLRSIGSYVSGAFTGTGQAIGNVFSKVKNGTVWSSFSSKWSSLGKLGKTTGVLGAIGFGFDVADTVKNIKDGNYVDAAGSGLSALGTGLTTAALFAGPLAPALATTGLIVTGVSLIIEHREAIGKLAKKTWDGAKNLAKGIGETASNVWGGVKNAFSGLGGLFS